MIRVAIEGIDGAGKTTVARDLAVRMDEAMDRYAERPCPVAYAQYPGENAAGRLLRRCLSGEDEIRSRKVLLPLFIADALESEAEIAGLAKDTYLIQDRTPWVSGFVYQPSEWSWDALRRAYYAFGLVRPDIVLILDMPASLAADRCLQRTDKYTDAMFSEKAEALQIYRHRYLDISRTAGHPAAGRRHTAVISVGAPVSEIVDEAFRIIMAHTDGAR